MDPTTTGLFTALIAGGALAIAATITGVFSYFASRGAKQAVVSHVEDESGVIQRYEATMSRMEGKIDNILEWQGGHEALHARQHDDF